MILRRQNKKAVTYSTELSKTTIEEPGKDSDVRYRLTLKQVVCKHNSGYTCWYNGEYYCDGYDHTTRLTLATNKPKEEALNELDDIMAALIQVRQQLVEL